MVVAARRDAFGRGYILFFDYTDDGELVLRRKRVS